MTSKKIPETAEEAIAAGWKIATEAEVSASKALASNDRPPEFTESYCYVGPCSEGSRVVCFMTDSGCDHCFSTTEGCH